MKGVRCVKEAPRQGWLLQLRDGRLTGIAGSGVKGGDDWLFEGGWAHTDSPRSLSPSGVYLGSGADAVAAKPRPSAARDAPVLGVEEVHTFYGKSHILNGVSFGVREGEIVALLGRNGAGKSTVLKSIIGIAPPAWEKKPPASRISFIASKGAPEMSPPSPVSSPSLSGPLFSMATPLLTSSTWPSSSAVMLATRL